MPRVIGHDGARFIVDSGDLLQMARERKKARKCEKKLNKIKKGNRK